MNYVIVSIKKYTDVSVCNEYLFPFGNKRSAFYSLLTMRVTFEYHVQYPNVTNTHEVKIIRYKIKRRKILGKENIPIKQCINRRHSNSRSIPITPRNTQFNHNHPQILTIPEPILIRNLQFSNPLF